MGQHQGLMDVPLVQADSPSSGLQRQLAEALHRERQLQAAMAQMRSIGATSPSGAGASSPAAGEPLIKGSHVVLGARQLMAGLPA